MGFTPCEAEQTLQGTVSQEKEEGKYEKHKRKISESKKETVEIRFTSGNGDKKIMQFVRIKSGPATRIMKWN